MMRALRSGWWTQFGSNTAARAPASSLTRYTMYGRLAGVLAAAQVPERGVVLSISGSRPLVEATCLSRLDVVEAEFPSVDLRALPFESSRFDAVVADQVLEHVEADPVEAVAESFRVARPGGLVVHTTCLMNPLHPSPGDYWRFTTDGLALLAREHGELLEVGSWGNRLALALIAAGGRTLKVPSGRYRPVHRIAAHNEVNWPIVTWVVASKT